MKLLKYIGEAGTRILSKVDLAGLGADAETVLKNFEGDAISFVSGVAVELNTHVAEFIAEHPVLAHEFHLLSDDEAAAEAAQNPPVELVAEDSPAASSSSSDTTSRTSTPTMDDSVPSSTGSSSDA